MSEAFKRFHVEEAIGKTHDWQTTRRLLRYLKPYLRAFIPALVLTLLLNLLRVSQPKFMQYAIDWYILPRDPGGLRWLAFIFFGVLLLSFAVAYFQSVLLATVGQRVMFDLRNELFSKLQRQEIAYYDRNPVGRVMTRITSDVDSLNELFTSGVIDILGDALMIFAIVGAMLWMDWRLTLVTLVTVPLLFIATAWFRRYVRRCFDLVRTRLARLNAFLQEQLSGAMTVQAFNAEAQSLKKFRSINDDYRNANLEAVLYYAIFVPLVELIGAFVVALIVWYGGGRIMLDAAAGGTALSLGVLVAFIQYSQQLFQPIRDLSDKYNVLQAAVVASQRIFQTLDLPVAVQTPRRSIGSGRALGRVEFRHVWFAYQDEDWVLKDVSFVFEPGESVAFVGHTGAGKTTITNLVLRFYDVQRGQVLLDGVDVRDWDLRELRRNFATVLQDVFLFSGTVESNIRLGDAGIDNERVERAAREVHADKFILRLPDGYLTQVRERGAGLSVGQKQLLSFARALARDPALLILDEATSSIDTETELLIRQAVERAMSGRTSLVVAHRLSTIQRADRIVVMHHGEVREQGTHQELLARRGLYWRLYQLQYAGGEPVTAAEEVLLSGGIAHGD